MEEEERAEEEEDFEEDLEYDLEEADDFEGVEPDFNLCDDCEEGGRGSLLILYLTRANLTLAVAGQHGKYDDWHIQGSLQ